MIRRTYEALLVDLDGTLVTDDDRILPGTIESLRQAQERGVRVMVSTGRSELATVGVLLFAAGLHDVALVNGDPPLRKPEDLRHHTLLHVDWKDAEASWRMWLLAAGLDDIDPTRGPRFTMESMAVQAALDGQGVALVGDMLVADELAAGRLVRPFDRSLSTPLSFSYYLLSPKDGDEQPKVVAFRDWLLEEARASRPEAGDTP